jgi:hypothetical protein
MSDVSNEGQRLPWAKPEVRRISAGSAEATSKTPGTPDGGSGPSGKIYS